jgi:uncharacterized protein (TIGR03067 family)
MLCSRSLVFVVAAVGTAAVRADEDPGPAELKRLEGVWASTPAKKGRDRGHVLAFHGGRMVWRSFQTLDGEPLIGHDELYDIALDPKASPRQITATRLGRDDREARPGIYELDGDTLKIAFGSGPDGGRPKGFADADAQVLTLARKKGAKVPDLSKADKDPKETAVEPTAKWFGQVADKAVAKACPEKPVTTAAAFEKAWKALRGDEAVPKVDFAKEFVLVRTSQSTLGKITGLRLTIVEGEDEVDDAITHTVPSDLKKVDGMSYGIAVFRRDLVDVADGRIVPKRPKK